MIVRSECMQEGRERRSGSRRWARRRAARRRAARGRTARRWTARRRAARRRVERVKARQRGDVRCAYASGRWRCIGGGWQWHLFLGCHLHRGMCAARLRWYRGLRRNGGGRGAQVLAKLIKDVLARMMAMLFGRLSKHARHHIDTQSCCWEQRQEVGQQLLRRLAHFRLIRRGHLRSLCIIMVVKGINSIIGSTIVFISKM